MADTDQEPSSKETPAFENGKSLSHDLPRILLHEAYYLPLPLRSPSNIYSLLHLCLGDANKLVVTTLRGEVYCLEFHDPLTQRHPSFKSITFSYLPGSILFVHLF